MKNVSDTPEIQVLLYYCYHPIADVQQFAKEHHLFCIANGLLGRIIVAEEGLNGTVSGTPEACESYMNFVHNLPGFDKTEFKVDYSATHAFQKLNVRIKPEIVHSDLHEIKPYVKTGKYLEPQDLPAMMNRDDVVLMDVRSNYEHEMGRFKGAVTFDIENFREFKDKLPEIESFKDKTIVTYCTGGIKCEKASAYLLDQGFENVYQLHGGIIKYGLETDGRDFEGKCYVFDNRLTVDINKANPTVISKCFVCGTISDRMVNCANATCNNHVAICETCGWEMAGACSDSCKSSPDLRAYDGTGYYAKKLNGYNPLVGYGLKEDEVQQFQKI